MHGSCPGVPQTPLPFPVQVLSEGLTEQYELHSGLLGSVEQISLLPPKVQALAGAATVAPFSVQTGSAGSPQSHEGMPPAALEQAESEAGSVKVAQ